MIELNLLPKELRKKEKKPLPKIKIVPIAIGVAATLVSVHLIFVAVVFAKSMTLKHLKSKWQEMQPLKTKTETMYAEIADLDKRMTAIRKIARPQLDWVRMLSGLNQAVTPSVWLFEFKPVAGKGAQQNITSGTPATYLQISGYALGGSQQGTASVAKFINSLKKTQDFYVYFDDVELEMINSRTIAGEDVMLFKLRCAFKGAAQAQEPKKETKKTSKVGKSKNNGF